MGGCATGSGTDDVSNSGWGWASPAPWGAGRSRELDLHSSECGCKVGSSTRGGYGTDPRRYSAVEPTSSRRSRELCRERGRCSGITGGGHTADCASGGSSGRCSKPARRGGWKWRPRGCRAGTGRRPGKQSGVLPTGPEGFGSCSGAASGLVAQGSGERQEAGKEREEGRQEEEIEEGQEEEKTRIFKQFFEQQIPQPFIGQQHQQQLKHRLRKEKASSLEREGARSKGKLRRLGSCGRVEVEEEGRPDCLCSEEPGGFDGSFPGRGVREVVEGHPCADVPAERCFGSSLGASVHGLDRGAGSEGSLNLGRDLGFGESPGDRPSYGHPLPEDPCHPGRKAQGGFMGEGGVHRAGQHAAVPCQHLDAGFDERLVGHFRRAWRLPADGGEEGSIGFGEFFSGAVAGLAAALGGRGCSCAFGAEIVRIRELLNEFKQNPGGSLKQSPAHVFPLPPYSQGGTVVTDGASCRPITCPGFVQGANLVMAALNSLYGGHDGVSRRPILSAAHGRAHARIACTLEAMVLTDEPILSSDGLDKFLKQSEHYSGAGVVLALGVKGGVPAKAADVPLQQHLESTFPEMADQVSRPAALLLPSKRRPRRVKRGYTWLAPSYPELVFRNIKAGLHSWKKPREVARHRGRVCLAGAFAVRKDETEDRVITDPSVNQLLNPDKLPRPRFAYIPKMRSIHVPSTGVVLVSKRDARHYFHRLRIGRRWRRWLCGPPVKVKVGGREELLYPASCSAPMGFGPSAGWAQGLTDVVAGDAKLPQDMRLHPDAVAPECLPLWGSIVDDVWAIEHSHSQLDAGVGAAWMDNIESAWVARGVEPNAKKTIDSALGEEVQGYYIHPHQHWVGVSIEKRRHLFQATMWLLRQRKVLVAVVDRVIGKHGFVHSARSCLRSIFEVSYSWLTNMRGRRRELVQLPRAVWTELAISAILLPFCSFNLSAEWSTRVECTDASMSGIGRAWGVAPRHVVQTIARYCDHSQVYTNLKLPWSIGLTTQHKCPLRRIRIPVERIRWHLAGSPWAPEHITLGEADAITWSAEDRLRRPGDDGCRFIHPVDSAACAGCFSKGRSTSRQLNRRCRRLCAINLAGGHDVFYPWLPSHENPADLPSRWWEPQPNCSGGQDGEPTQPEPVSEVDLSGLSLWPQDAVFFIHLCSGPRQDGDLCHWVESLSSLHEVNVIGLCIDPLAADWQQRVWFQGCGAGDLLNEQHAFFLLDLIQSGKVCGGFASPPYKTFSRAVHVVECTNQQPRQLRARSSVWDALECCTARERHAVTIESTLVLICLGLLGEMILQGAWVGLGHPADAGEPYPSIFCSHEVNGFCSRFKLRQDELHQCMYGAVRKLPTTLLLPSACGHINLKCTHLFRHRPWLEWGSDASDHCHRAAGVKYPSALCHTLASNFVDRLSLARRKGYSRPFRPRLHLREKLKDPWVGVRDVGWAWPEPRANFLVENIAALHTGQISAGVSSPQQ